MHDDKPKPRWLGRIIAVIACFCLFVLAYFGGYVGLSSKEEVMVTELTIVDGQPSLVMNPCIFRDFKPGWLATIFKPAAQLEQRITGKQVHLNITRGTIEFDPQTYVPVTPGPRPAAY